MIKDMFFSGNDNNERKRGGAKLIGGQTWSENEEKRNIKIARTPEGYVDMKASYYTISLRLPREWEEDLKRIAWEKRVTVTELFRLLAEQELKRDAQEHEKRLKSALKDFDGEFATEEEKGENGQNMKP